MSTPHIKSPTPPALPQGSQHQTYPPGLSFLTLPPSTRSTIYTLILQIPGLICIRQNRTHPWSGAPPPYHLPYLLPGISYALTHSSPRRSKASFTHSRTFNIALLRVCRAVYAEAAPLFYRTNTFELQNLYPDSIPAVNLAILPFAPRCVPLVRRLCIQGSSPRELSWIVRTGYKEIRRAYPGLRSLTLLLRLDLVEVGRMRLLRGAEEVRELYVLRLHDWMNGAIFRGGVHKVPRWLNVRLVLGMDWYEDALGEGVRKCEQDEGFEGEDLVVLLRASFIEAWEIFKRG